MSAKTANTSAISKVPKLADMSEQLDVFFYVFSFFSIRMAAIGWPSVNFKKKKTDLRMEKVRR